MITNSAIEEYLKEKSKFLNDFDPALVKMHVLSEKVSSVPETKLLLVIHLIKLTTFRGGIFNFIITRIIKYKFMQ